MASPVFHPRCFLSFLKTLIDHPYGEVFRDVTSLTSSRTYGSEFLKKIKKPMDFETIKKKMEKGLYSGVEGFVEDVRLVFSNAMMFYSVDNDVHKMADKLSRDFESGWKSVAQSAVIHQKNQIQKKSSLSSSLKEEIEEESPLFMRFMRDEAPRRTPDTVLRNSSRASLLKARFAKTISKAEMILGDTEMKWKRKREREAAREELERMKKTVKFDEFEDHKAFKELEKLCGCALSYSITGNQLCRLGLYLKDDGFDTD